MAQELSLLCGYGSGEDEDDNMMDGEDGEGAGGKVVLVGMDSKSDDGQDGSMEVDLPLLQPQPQARPGTDESGEGQLAGESPTSRVHDGQEAGGQEGGELDDDYAILPEELRAAPPGSCDPEMQRKVAQVLAVKNQQGALFSTVLAQQRGYRNPDFLEKMITHFNIKERGSNFSQEVFDPYGLPADDYISALEKQLTELRAKKEQERAARKQVDFARGGVQQPPVPKPTISHVEAAAKARLLVSQKGWDK